MTPILVRSFPFGVGDRQVEGVAGLVDEPPGDQAAVGMGAVGVNRSPTSRLGQDLAERYRRVGQTSAGRFFTRSSGGF